MFSSHAYVFVYQLRAPWLALNRNFRRRFDDEKKYVTSVYARSRIVHVLTAQEHHRDNRSHPAPRLYRRMLSAAPWHRCEETLAPSPVLLGFRTTYEAFIGSLRVTRCHRLLAFIRERKTAAERF